MNNTLTIFQLARLSGVNVETIRFYERQDLIPKPPRGSSGFSHYPHQTAESIRFIRVAKGLGYSLPEIQKLLALYSLPDFNNSENAQDLRAAIESMNGKIRAFTKMRDTLVAFNQ